MSSNDLSVTPLSLQRHYGWGIQQEHSLDFKRTGMGVFVKPYQEKRENGVLSLAGSSCRHVNNLPLSVLRQEAGAVAETVTNRDTAGLRQRAPTVAFYEKALAVLFCETWVLSGFWGGQWPSVCVCAT